MTAKTGNGTMTYSVEIPTTNSGFSIMTSSIKDEPNDFDNDRLPKLQDWRPSCHFWLSVVDESVGDTLFELAMVKKSRTCRWNFDAHAIAEVPVV